VGEWFRGGVLFVRKNILNDICLVDVVYIRRASAVSGSKRQYAKSTYCYGLSQFCGSVRNSSKFTIKPTHSTVVKGYEKAAQALKFTISTPNFLSRRTACFNIVFFKFKYSIFF
jgi:hypothetical protein